LELETFELETHFLVFECLGQPSIVDQPLQHNFDRNPIVMLDPFFPSFQISSQFCAKLSNIVKPVTCIFPNGVNSTNGTSFLAQCCSGQA
jgi:hypothetical protein